jgi:hypothetical protein
MDNRLIIPRPLAMSEVIRASDFLIINPKETHTVSINRFPLKGMLRDFCLTDRNNVGRVYLEINGQTVWEHVFTENESLEWPFWQGIDVYDSTLFVFTFVCVCVEPRDKDQPFSLEISYTPVFEVSDVFKLKNKLCYLYELARYEHLFVKEGCGLYIDTQKEINYLDKKIGQTLSVFSEEEKRELYLKEGWLPISKYKNRSQIIKSSLQKTNPVGKYLFYVYTHDVETIRKDEKLREFANVSNYIVQTFPPALDITVDSENLTRFRDYMTKTYPKADAKVNRQMNFVDEDKTTQLRSEEIRDLTNQWQKILDSRDNVPEEISIEDFRNLPKESEKVQKFLRMLEKMKMPEDHGIIRINRDGSETVC